MKSVVIPLNFFKAIGEKPPIIRVIWIKWLAEYSEELFKPDFIQNFHLTMEDKNLNLETIKEAYDFGIRFFEDGFAFIEGKKERKIYNREVLEIVNKVLRHLNEMVGSTYTASKPTIECISARLKDGYTISELIRVIDRKAEQWQGTEQAKFLRPITLFQAKKFENYLNEPEKITNGNNARKKGNIQSLTDAANKAKQLFA